MGLFSSSEKKQKSVYYSPSEVLNAVYDNAHANNNMICVMFKDMKMLLEQNKELLERVKRLEERSLASRSERIPLSVAR